MSLNLISISVAVLIAMHAVPVAGARETSRIEDSYSIELVKTAEPGHEIRELEGRRVHGRIYTVKKGDYVYRILRQHWPDDRRRLPEIFELLKKINPSLTDPNLIYPGQDILVPVKIEPIDEPAVPDPAPAETVSVPIPEIEPLPDHSDMEITRYTVRRGDTITGIIERHNDIPSSVLYGPYMEMLKKLNPALKDVNLIYPGQVINIPLYRRGPLIKSTARPEAEPAFFDGEIRGAQGRQKLWSVISGIFSEMGEKCIQRGAHFIPLPSGGQVDLKADTFPLVVLEHGVRMVVDIHGMLPEGIRKLIESAWDMYRVVDLTGAHTIDEALERMLEAGGYAEVSRATEPLLVETDFQLSVRGDWIVSMLPGSGGTVPRTAVINLSSDIATPGQVKEYLQDNGVLLIESAASGPLNAVSEAVSRVAGSPASLVAELLDLAGISYSAGVQIPVYQSAKSGIRLVIDVDFLLRLRGMDAVIDVRGLPPEILSFLDEHRFKVLTLSGPAGGMTIAEKVLRFAEIPSGPFSGLCPPGPVKAGNVELSLRGACFHSGDSGTVIVTPFRVPGRLEPLLSGSGIKVLWVSF